MKLVYLALAVVLLGCGGAHNSLPPGQSSGCTVTLSGAVAGTFPCQPANTVWSSSNNTGGFSFTVTQSGTTPGVTTAIGWAGEPQTGRHYQSTDAGAKGGVTVTMGSGASISVWAATVGGVSQPVGSYDLLFTSLANAITTSSGKAYNGEGTLDATLQPLSGPGGTVTLHAVF